MGFGLHHVSVLHALTVLCKHIIKFSHFLPIVCGSLVLMAIDGSVRHYPLMGPTFRHFALTLCLVRTACHATGQHHKSAPLVPVLCVLF